jgi:glycosyltransferase involved in cell wall biosynthesis
MRILFVVNTGWFFLSHRLSLARAAIAKGFEVHLATSAQRPAVREAIEAEGIHLHVLPLDRSGISVTKELRTLLSMLRLYSNLRPDLVHLVTAKPVLYGTLAARWCRIKAVVSAIPGLGYIFLQRGVVARIQRAVLFVCYRFALRHRNSKVIFQNHEQLELFVDAGVISRRDAVLIRGAGVDLEQFRPTPEPHGPVTIVLAARMLKEKGVFEFVEAARMVRACGLDARFLLVGDVDAGNPGSLPPELLKQWHAEGTVEWIGHRDDIPAVFAQAHIVCLPTYGEGLPKVLLEAAASGRPIVTTDIPGCRDVGRNGVNALLVPPRDATALAAALECLIRDAPMRRRFGRAARQLAENEFSTDIVVGHTLSIYDTLLNRAGARRVSFFEDDHDFSETHSPANPLVRGARSAVVRDIPPPPPIDCHAALEEAPMERLNEILITVDARSRSFSQSGSVSSVSQLSVSTSVKRN